MKKKCNIQITVFVITLIAVLGVLALFTDTALATEHKEPFVRLQIINRSQFDFVLYLYGPTNYGLKEQQIYEAVVPPGGRAKLFVDRDMYEYYMEACNYSKKGDMDITIYQTIHVPPCGGNAAGFKNKHHHIDVSKLLKPIKVRVINETGDAVGVYLRTIDDHHFLNFEKGEEQSVILLREDGSIDDYVYSFQGCGGQLVSGYYTPRVTPPLILECP